MESILIVGVVVGIVVGLVLGIFIGRILRDRFWNVEIDKHRKDAVLRSRSVLSGMFSEQLAPYFPNFPGSPTECRFIGKPIDFLIFKGIDGKEIEEVVFVEVKSGNSKLSKVEKSLKKVIESGKVSWKEYRISDDVLNFSGND